MSALAKRLSGQLSKNGVKDSESMAFALLNKRKQAKGNKLTKSGKQRQSLGASGRAKSRAAKYHGGKPSDYKYNSRTNMALKK